MKPYVFRALYFLSHLGILLAVLLAFLPMGMRAYGNWTQARENERFLASLPPPAPRVVQPNPVLIKKKATKKAAPKKRLPRRQWERTLLQIPSIKVSSVVKEAKGNWRWVTGPAYQPGTPGPGGAGNCIIAAHRNMWDATFARLPKVKRGDRVYVVTPSGRYTYVVYSSRVVSTSNKTPLHDTMNGKLTLYTCVLPFNARRRWVVQCRLVQEESSKRPVREY